VLEAVEVVIILVPVVVEAFSSKILILLLPLEHIPLLLVVVELVVVELVTVLLEGSVELLEPILHL
tara:strand:- start:290 stop:487 length:198 start_codon:yes stop_codon:yes gene_type:complete